MNELDSSPELNITPLVDIMLVLMAILMVVMPSVVYSEHINLPQGSKSSKVEDKALTLEISSKKEIVFNKQRFDFFTFADNLALQSAGIDKDKSVQIRAAKDLAYDDVVKVLVTLKQLGFKKISLQTQ